MYPDPGPLASETSDQMIRFNLFRFLNGKKVAICPEKKKKKTNENSIQMVSPPCLTFVFYCFLTWCVATNPELKRWLFTTIRHYSWLFAAIRHYSWLFAAIRHYSWLFAAFRHYSWLFAAIRHYSCHSLLATIPYSSFQDTLLKGGNGFCRYIITNKVTDVKYIWNKSYIWAAVVDQ